MSALDDDGLGISIGVGITIGLIASFIQSLGLTIQRKSHILNESLPPHLQKRDFKRPLWIGGFLIFICSNLLGTIFQIGALPIVVLGPLGAVSLLYNAFFAKIILGDRFTLNLIAGTILIAGGAVLIGIFGVVPGENDAHTLEELIAFYVRTPFLIWISLLTVFLVALLLYAHITEWKFEHKISKWNASRHTDGESNELGTPKRGNELWRRRGRVERVRSEEQLLIIPTNGIDTLSGVKSSNYGALTENSTLVQSPLEESQNLFKLTTPALTQDFIKSSFKAPPTLEEIDKIKLVLGIAYGSISGTLSGLCLLFAKTGIELLILTVMGRNQVP